MKYMFFIILFAINSISFANDLTVEEFYSSYEKLYEQKKYSEAYKAIKEAYRLSRKKKGEKNIDTQKIKLKYAQIYVTTKAAYPDYDTSYAADMLFDIIKYWKKKYNKKHSSLIEPLKLLGIVYIWRKDRINLDDYPTPTTTKEWEAYQRVHFKSNKNRAERRFRAAIQIAKKKYLKKQPLKYADLHFEISKRLIQTRSNEMLALKWMATADEIYTRKLNSTDEKLMDFSFWYAKALHNIDDYKNSFKLLVFVQQYYEHTNEDPKNNLTYIYTYLVKNLMAQGFHSAATEYALKIGQIRSDKGIKFPKLLYQVEPQTNKSFLKNSFIKLKFMIDEEGYVTSSEVESLKGADEHLPAIQEAIMRWRYAPLFKDGKAIKSSTFESFQFIVQK